MVRKEIHIVLRKTPKPSLPHVWADLFMKLKTNHSYGLPADLTEEERTEIMGKIQDEIGIKACWREYLKRNGWTDELFDDWWLSATEEKLKHYLGQNSTDGTERSGGNSHLPLMLSLAAVLGSIVGQFLIGIIFRLLKIS